MFDFYAEKLKKYQANVPKIFKRIAKKAAIKAENEAKEITDSEELVDTGAYKAAWSANSGEIEKDVYAVALSNSMDYASHLEWGHKVRGKTKLTVKIKGKIKRNKKIRRLLGKKGMRALGIKVRKHKKIRKELKGYSNGTRVKGFFVGRNALEEAHYYAIQQLDKVTEQAMIDYNNSFLSD